MEPYDYVEAAAAHFANGDENTQLSEEEIVLDVLGESEADKLTSLALRIVLPDHVGTPPETSRTY